MSIDKASGLVSRDPLREAMELACQWITEVAQIKTDQLPNDCVDERGFGYETWGGAMRGEYRAGSGEWGFMCPVWHTGQAVKALVLAEAHLSMPGLMDCAKLGAEFIYHNQVWQPDHPDHGLILAFEDFGDKVNTSAILEAMDGLMYLADATSDEEAWKRIVAAGLFVVDKFMQPEGVMLDVYDPAEHRAIPNVFPVKHGMPGRPLLDDGILLKLYDRTGEAKFLESHLKIADRLVADQNPPGNWVDYGPCNAKEMRFHPRHTYWWALPLIETFRRTNNASYLETAIAAGEFCRRAMRPDGGYFRGTYADFRTDSFGHATSGSASGAILFLELFKLTGERKWLDLATLAIDFCTRVQFREPEDSNLRGSILEKVLPPDGTDRSPYYLRDLGTIFFVMAGAWYLDTLSSIDAAKG